MEYKEEDFLSISGIQHFAFCRRQWALIYLEQQWQDNALTAKGNTMHRNAHEGICQEKRGNILISRAMPVFSRSLGVSGICDVVEFRKSDAGVYIHSLGGVYKVLPVEYKRGEPKEHDADILQVVAQTVCLEEMLCTQINSAAIYYGRTHRRQDINVTQELRNKLTDIVEEMHSCLRKGYTPKCKKQRKCNACSLYDICMPQICGMNEGVSEYIRKAIGYL